MRCSEAVVSELRAQGELENTLLQLGQRLPHGPARFTLG